MKSSISPILVTFLGGWRGEMLGAWNAIWRRYFAESALSRRETLELMQYTISVLSGLATTRMLEGPGARMRSRELDFLKQTLADELTRGGERLEVAG